MLDYKNCCTIRVIVARNDLSRTIVRREPRRFALTRGRRSYEAYDIQRRLAPNARCTPHPRATGYENRKRHFITPRRANGLIPPPAAGSTYVHIRGGRGGKADAR